jgi:hypothetical protein
MDTGSGGVTVFKAANNISPSGPPVLYLPSILGQSPSAVDATLGTPYQVTTSFRNYRVFGTEEVMVRFYSGYAASVTVYLERGETSALLALQRVGINGDVLHRAGGFNQGTYFSWWYQVNLGLPIEKIGAIKDGAGTSPGTNWDVVQAVVMNSTPNSSQSFNYQEIQPPSFNQPVERVRRNRQPNYGTPSLRDLSTGGHPELGGIGASGAEQRRR